MDQNGSEWIRIYQNGSNLIKHHNGPEWIRKDQNGSNWMFWIKLDQNGWIKIRNRWNMIKCIQILQWGFSCVKCTSKFIILLTKTVWKLYSKLQKRSSNSFCSCSLFLFLLPKREVSVQSISTILVWRRRRRDLA